jgi:hypothetical protein
LQAHDIPNKLENEKQMAMELANALSMYNVEFAKPHFFILSKKMRDQISQKLKNTK